MKRQLLLGMESSGSGAHDDMRIMLAQQKGWFAVCLIHTRMLLEKMVPLTKNLTVISVRVLI